MAEPGRRGRRRPPVDGAEQHRDWLSLVELDGTFLTLPVLTRVWPTLAQVDAEAMARLRDAHVYAEVKPRAWVEFVVEDLLGWGGSDDASGGRRDSAVTWSPDRLCWTPPEHDVEVVCDFACSLPATAGPDLGPGQAVLLGYVLDGPDPRARVTGDDWAATAVDRAAAACRALNVPLALVTNGRLWTLVWAPRGRATTTATFDSATWSDASDRVVVRAFTSLFGRDRFTAVPDDERLPALLTESLDAQEQITDVLGVQVRRAVELVVEAMGRWDAREAATGSVGLDGVPTGQVYAGAVRVLMRVVFLLFAEERRLLPSDNPLYVDGYGTAALCDRLEADAGESGEEALEHRTGAWLQLIATAAAIYRGVRTSRLMLTAYDGSLFDPDAHPWLTRVGIDDRTVLHMLRSVLYVTIKGERRRVSFRTLAVEQIGYVYEGLLAFDAERSTGVVVGLVGKPGLEEEVPLTELEALLGRYTDLDTGIVDHAGLAADLAERYKPSGIGSTKRLTGLLTPPRGPERTERLQRLLAVTEGDRSVAERLLPLAGIIRADLRGLPTVIAAGALFATSSSLRASSGTHYTPPDLAELLTTIALEPLVHRHPGPLDTDDRAAWVPVSSAELLALKIADIAMGSGAFLVAACRYLADKLVEAWAAEGRVDALRHLVRAEDADAPVLRTDGAVPPVLVEARRAVIEHCLYGVDINPAADGQAVAVAGVDGPRATVHLPRRSAASR